MQGDLAAPRQSIVVSGKFALDNAHNPPPLKHVKRLPDGTEAVRLGRGVELSLLRDHDTPLERLLDARIRIDTATFTGLGSVEGGCSVFCTSNQCREWAVRNRSPRPVAKVIGVALDQPRYVLLTIPRLTGSPRLRKETKANRLEAGLVPFYLVEPAEVECAMCVGRNRGELRIAG